MFEDEFIMEIILHERKTTGHDSTKARLSQIIKEAKRLWSKSNDYLDDNSENYIS